MFYEDVETRANGPVVANFWHDENKQRPTPAATELPQTAVEIVSYVVARYGRLTGQELKRLTHAEGPWLEASQRDSELDWFDQTISKDSLRRFFLETDGMPQEAERTDVLRQSEIYGWNPLKMTPSRRAAIQNARTRGIVPPGV